jgi:hypothetical protein
VTLEWTVTNATSISIDQGIGAITPAGDGSVTASVSATKIFTLTAMNGGGSVSKTATACVATGVPQLAVAGQTSYTCHQPYKETFTVSNPTCDQLTVSGIALSAMVTASNGNCVPPAIAHYPASVAAVGPGTTGVVVLDLTGNDFCCIGSSCPASFTCDETYTSVVAFTADGGTVTAMSDVHVDLGGCNEVCPP